MLEQIFAKRLKEARKAKGWAQLDLANALNIRGNRTITRVNRGRSSKEKRPRPKPGRG